jgi:hypothetical protein
MTDSQGNNFLDYPGLVAVFKPFPVLAQGCQLSVSRQASSLELLTFSLILLPLVQASLIPLPELASIDSAWIPVNFPQYNNGL